MTRLFPTLVALAIAGSVAAQGAQVTFGTMQRDRNAPIEVTADSLSVSDSDGTAVFEGNVVIGQNDMRLTASTVRVLYKPDRSGIMRLVASGGVTMVAGEEAAEARDADYDVDAGVVVMTGDVLLTQGQNALAAQRMVVNLDTGTAQMDGRVRTVLQPGTAGGN